MRLWMMRAEHIQPLFRDWSVRKDPQRWLSLAVWRPIGCSWLAWSRKARTSRLKNGSANGGTQSVHFSPPLRDAAGSVSQKTMRILPHAWNRPSARAPLHSLPCICCWCDLLYVRPAPSQASCSNNAHSMLAKFCAGQWWPSPETHCLQRRSQRAGVFVGASLHPPWALPGKIFVVQVALDCWCPSQRRSTARCRPAPCEGCRLIGIFVMYNFERFGANHIMVPYIYIYVYI